MKLGSSLGFSASFFSAMIVSKLTMGTELTAPVKILRSCLTEDEFSETAEVERTRWIREGEMLEEETRVVEE